MKTKKIITLAICFVIAILCLGYVGIRSFTKNIYNSQSCEWANIDNIEMRAMVDIPKIESSDCEYDTISKTKKVLFLLDKELDTDAYIIKNKLQKVAETKTLSSFNLKPEELANAADFYFREKTTEWESYKILLDSKSGKLWIDLKYLD